MSATHTLQLTLKPGQHDGDGQRVAEAAARHLGLATGRVRSAALYTVRYPLSRSPAARLRHPLPGRPGAGRRAPGRARR
jgi:hypothetical protein